MKNNAYDEMYENELTHPWYRATRQMLIEYLFERLKKSASVLDAGCGTGGTIKALNKAGYLNVTGIDNNKLAIKYCKKNKISKVSFANINRLPFKDKSFDAVVCLDVLYHKGVSMKLALSEFHRVLKPLGILYIQEPAYNWLASKHDVAIQTKRRFTKKQLVDFLRSAGFKTVKSSYFNAILFLPILVERVINKLSQEKNPKSDVYPIPPILDSIIYRVLIIEVMLIKKISLPFGLSVICISQNET